MSIELSIIIITYNSEAEIRNCLNSIRENALGIIYEIIVVDNDSKDLTVKIIKENYPDVVVIANECNIGFPAANNQAIVSCKGEKILLLNPDTIVHQSALQELSKYLDENMDCGICSAQLIDANGIKAPDLLPLNSWRYLVQLLSGGAIKFDSLPDEQQMALSGACLMFRKSLISKIGILDESMFWGEDLDYCARTRRAGMTLCKRSSVFITHIVGQSTKSNMELYLLKQYYSKISYLRQHARRPMVALITCLYIFECLLRLIKWSILSFYKDSTEAKIRRQCFLKLSMDLPKELLK